MTVWAEKECPKCGGTGRLITGELVSPPHDTVGCNLCRTTGKVSCRPETPEEWNTYWETKGDRLIEKLRKA